MPALTEVMFFARGSKLEFFDANQNRRTVGHKPCGGDFDTKVASMMPATARNKLVGIYHGAQLGDLHAEFIRAFDEMFPGERTRPLRCELVVERHGIVIVEQDEMVADGQRQPGLDDQAVFDRTGNRPHVHYFVGAEEGFSLY